MPDLELLRQAIIKGDAASSAAVTREALAADCDPVELVSKYMVPAMDEVGRRFECQDYFVPELLLSARAMKKALELIRPLLAERGAVSAGRVVIGTVKGDLHDIGKNLVASMLEGAGFEVFDLGVDVAPQKFVSEAKEKNAGIIALSALLTTTMPSMQQVVEEVKKAGIRSDVRIIIGGAPVTPQYADQIGADGYSDNASAAVALARRLVAQQ
jgi:5-methyltetrahydrofolate--homocysteine methyltransferase